VKKTTLIIIAVLCISMALGACAANEPEVSETGEKRDIFGWWYYGACLLADGMPIPPEEAWMEYPPWLFIYDDYTITIAFYQGSNIQAQLARVDDFTFEITSMHHFINGELVEILEFDAFLIHESEARIRVFGFFVTTEEEGAQEIYHAFARGMGDID
jgi:hypothetical protein